MFAGHAEQLTLDIFEQLNAPANEYKPVAHVKQLPTLVAPTTLDDVPAGQCTHASAAAKYVPAGQSFVQTLAPVMDIQPDWQS